MYEDDGEVIPEDSGLSYDYNNDANYSLPTNYSISDFANYDFIDPADYEGFMHYLSRRLPRYQYGGSVDEDSSSGGDDSRSEEHTSELQSH